ncbi:DOPA-like domain-containing protein [Xylariaceae sp. FL0255]|nr:DOPA-like domain-containing protein [Xylariaceae sp. FL0255]
MSLNAFDYTYPSPLAGFENLPPLPNDRAEDGKSFVNPKAEKRSEAYEKFVEPLNNGRRGGFDVHIYYMQNNKDQTKYAHDLWERIRREFPELRIYQLWDRPLGPHPIAMFEVNLLSPEEFGAFVPWLAIWRGPLSALVHPNTLPSAAHDSPADTTDRKREARDHSQRAIWMGERIPLDFSFAMEK